MAVGEVAVLGVGMHPWGKWGKNFVEYGVVAARDALADEKLVVLGQIEGPPESLRVGAEVELVLSTLFTDDDGEHVVWKWKVVG